MDTVVVVLWIVGLIFVLISVINLIRRAIKSKRCTARTTAVVTDIKEKVVTRNDIESREYIPTISYKVNGKDYSREFTKVYLGDTYKVGQSVEIMYNPDKPSEVNKQGLNNKADIIILIIGLVIILVGIVLLAVM
ncbi:MAG TPA: DUF3592 domain-containing protein [Chloroflexi bacterium]|jgi:hypothetical protein|nr:DUF3592 domain-containing protein [Anaerolineaceae bacterium]HHX09606.1 DUF3592 domain-containing protein [Chloroflexota bacterium]